MNKDESDFVALQMLVEQAQNNSNEVGQFILKSYWLGSGERSIDEIVTPWKKSEIANTKFRLVGVEDE